MDETSSFPSFGQDQEREREREMSLIDRPTDTTTVVLTHFSNTVNSKVHSVYRSVAVPMASKQAPPTATDTATTGQSCVYPSLEASLFTLELCPEELLLLLSAGDAQSTINNKMCVCMSGHSVNCAHWAQSNTCKFRLMPLQQSFIFPLPFSFFLLSIQCQCADADVDADAGV